LHTEGEVIISTIKAENYIDTVKIIAAKLLHGIKCTAEHREDIISEGFVGLCKAAKSFDPDKGVQFTTYASYRIRGSMVDYMVKWRGGMRNQWRVIKKMVVYSRQSGRSIEDIDWNIECDNIGLTPEKCRRALYVNSHAITLPVFQNALENCYTDKHSDFSDILIEAGLTDREQYVVQGSIEGERFLKDIGADIGLCESMAAQIRNKGFDKIRQYYDRQD